MTEITGTSLVSAVKTLISERGGNKNWPFRDARVNLAVRHAGMSPDWYVFIRVSSPGKIGRNFSGIALVDGSFNMDHNYCSEGEFYSRIEHFLD